MQKRTIRQTEQQGDLLLQGKRAETQAKIAEQKARLLASDADLTPSAREDFIPAPPGHQMSQDELQAEYEATQAQMTAEAGEEAVDEFGMPVETPMPPIDRIDPYVPKPQPPRLSQEEIEALKPKRKPKSTGASPQQVLAKRTPPEPQLPERLFAPAGEVDITGEAGIVSAVAREEAELKVAIILARQFPRNEAEAEGAIRRACGRLSFAQAALYSFPRSGTTIKGPSVNMARTLALAWGNLRHGTRIVSEDKERVHIKGYCFDVQTNHYVEHENKFQKLIPRKMKDGTTKWIEPNERDLRELIGRQGAILDRNAVLQSIPRDLVDLACELVEKTQRDGASKDPIGETQRLLAGFAAIGVHAENIAEKYHHAVEALTVEELVELRQIYASIRDGQSTRGEHFFVASRVDDPEGEGNRTDRLAKKLNGRG